MPRKLNLESLITAIVFLASMGCFSLASVNSCTQTKDTIAGLEKRKLAEFPPLESWRKNPQKFLTATEAFYNDRFAFRLPLISAHNLLDFTVFGTSGSPRVIIGRHGFLFSNDPFHAETALNSLPFSEDGLRLWARALQAKRDYLARNGIQYLLVLVPEKSSLYPENLPRGWYRRPGPSRLDRLQTYLRAHTDVEFVDAKSVLLANKDASKPLFLHNDTHWNCLGSFFVAQNALSHLQEHFPSVKPFQPSQYQLMEYSLQGGDLADQLCLPTFFNETNYVVHLQDQRARLATNVTLPVSEIRQREPQAFVVADPALPRGLLIGDSFISALAPYLADRLRFTEIHWTHEFPPDLLVSRKPDVVIEEIVERHLLDYPPDSLATIANNCYRSQAKTTRQSALARFGQNFELEDLTARQHENSLTVKLLWRSKIAQKLDGSVNMWLLNDKNQSLCQFNFWLDRYKKKVNAGDEFVTTEEIPTGELKDASQIAMVTIPWQKLALPVAAKHTDLGHYRLLLPLHDAEERGDVSDHFVADSGREIAL